MGVGASANTHFSYATLRLRPSVTVLDGFDEAPWPGRPAGSAWVVQEPRLRTSNSEVVVRVPNGGTVLLGGLDDPGPLPPTPAEPPDQAAADPSHSRLYVLVAPRIIVQEQAPIGR
jgi:hypothetical protein